MPRPLPLSGGLHGVAQVYIKVCDNLLVGIEVVDVGMHPGVIVPLGVKSREIGDQDIRLGDGDSAQQVSDIIQVCPYGNDGTTKGIIEALDSVSLLIDLQVRRPIGVKKCPGLDVSRRL
jgi:hypothetical protein